MDYGVFLPVSGAACTRAGLRHAAETAERLGFTTVRPADRSASRRWSGSRP